MIYLSQHSTNLTCPMDLSTLPPTLLQNDQDHGGLSTVSRDILQTHILTRLDGPTLAALSCTSSQFYTLSSQDKLWQDVCKSIWPSISHPLAGSVISTFPSGHRSFFSDSYPLADQWYRQSFDNLGTQFPTTTELISAVDVYYQNVPLLSEVEKTETLTQGFLGSPFRVDILQSKGYVPTWIHHVGTRDSWAKQLEQNVTLSWILIDPKEKRAINMSRKKPVAVQRHWLTGEVLVKFATILAGGGGTKGSVEEYVECEMVVTCGGEEGGEVQVRDVRMRMEDMGGKAMTGKDSLVVVEGAMTRRGERRKGKDEKERYKDFQERKRERIQRNQRRENVFDWICKKAAYFVA